MIQLPVIRWGQPYESLEVADVNHFATGEPIAKVCQAGGGIIKRDMRQAHKAREALRRIPARELIAMLGKAADLYEHGTLPMGDGQQSPADFVHQQSASTGLPEHMCRANMAKNSFVLKNMEKILDCLTRGLNLEILSRGYGEEDRSVTLSYQLQSPVLAAVLPSNSPGVHTLWLPAIPLQLGLVLKPGPQEPWTPYRIFAAFTEAGVPREAFSLYPGEAEAGAAVLEACDRSMIFGGTPTVERYRGNPKVQAHGPGFSKILLGDDVVDRWRDYLDLMVESIYLNSGRGCINCSGVWASRHTREIADALAERLGPIEALPPDNPQAGLAAFTVPGMGATVWQQIEQDMKGDGVTHATAKYGPRLVDEQRASYLRPTILHCESPESPAAHKEYMFPFTSVVACPQAEMLRRIGPTLVGTVITNDEAFRDAATNATNIDRLNLGPIPTTKLNWLQPHEGNLVDFLYRNRALQVA
ncbi:MAG TPA: aldehyde dehydrogenase family protein [Lacipirellulaceae bacterium]|jgi:acyl-CoA reductase-like NAD-dependent aldehyde dehydrogenase|nr:aldehyde dehydrogenase family protein [Lacipirellulaceae bacterium]